MAHFMPTLGDIFPDICVIALPERRPYVRGVLDKLGAPNAYYIDPVLLANVDMRSLKPSYPMSRGDAACVLSHRKCVSWYLQNGTAPHVLVFEDDVEVTVPNATQRLASVMHHLPQTWDALYVGRCWDRCWLDETVAPWLVRAHSPLCTHAIAYSRSGASAVARRMRALDLRSDDILSDMIDRGQLDAYAVKPGIFRQDNWRFGTTSSLPKPHYTEDCRVDNRAWYAAGSVALVGVCWAMARKIGKWTHKPALERRYMLAIINIVLAVALILTLKTLLVNWHYPLTCSWVGFAAVLLSLKAVEPAEVARSRLTSIALSSACAVGMVNVSLQQNAVGMYELFKGLVLPFSVAINLAYGSRERCKPLCCAALTFLFVVLGTVPHPYRYNALGVAAGLLAAAASAAEKTTVRHTVRHGVDALALLRATMPLSTTVLLFCSLLFEHDAYVLGLNWYQAFFLALSCVLCVGVNVTMHLMCGNINPVMYCCLAPIKTMVVVTLSASWGAALNTVGIIGASLFGAAYVVAVGNSKDAHELVAVNGDEA